MAVEPRGGRGASMSPKAAAGAGVGAMAGAGAGRAAVSPKAAPAPAVVSPKGGMGSGGRGDVGGPPMPAVVSPKGGASAGAGVSAVAAAPAPGPQKGRDVDRRGDVDGRKGDVDRRGEQEAGRGLSFTRRGAAGGRRWDEGRARRVVEGAVAPLLAWRAVAGEGRAADEDLAFPARALLRTMRALGEVGPGRAAEMARGVAGAAAAAWFTAAGARLGLASAELPGPDRADCERALASMEEECFWRLVRGAWEPARRQAPASLGDAGVGAVCGLVRKAVQELLREVAQLGSAGACLASRAVPALVAVADAAMVNAALGCMPPAAARGAVMDTGLGEQGE